MHLEKALELRNEHKMSYSKIAKAMTMHVSSIFYALKRYAARGKHIDNRTLNEWKNNPKRKITPELRRRMLDRGLLQTWSGYNLQQRCMLLERDFDLKITPKSLQQFYQRNNVRYLAVGYVYRQALARRPDAHQNFAVQLAKVILSGRPLVYFDEASFNLWMRNRKTWTPRAEPIKYPLNRFRGKGVTVMGAIS